VTKDAKLTDAFDSCDVVSSRRRIAVSNSRRCPETGVTMSFLPFSLVCCRKQYVSDAMLLVEMERLLGNNVNSHLSFASC
jgi:hypothetical protein